MKRNDEEQLEVLDEEITQEIKSNKPSAKETFLGIILGLGYLSIFVYVPLYLLVAILGNPTTYTGQLKLSTLAQVITAIIVVILMLVNSKKLIKEFIHGLSWDTVFNAIKYAVIVYLVGIFLNLLDIAIFGEQAATNANQSSIDDLMISSPVLCFTLCCACAPIIEELIFRFYIFRPFKEKKPIVGYIISGLSFGLIHMFSTLSDFLVNQDVNLLLNDLRSLPSYIAAGLIFCIAFKKHNVTTNILAHLFYNTFVSCLMLSSVGSQPLKITEVHTLDNAIILTIDLDEDNGVYVSGYLYKIDIEEEYRKVELNMHEDGLITIDHLQNNNWYDIQIEYHYLDAYNEDAIEYYNYQAKTSADMTILDK